MIDKPTIELPRLPDESARAYTARVEYVTMGAARSIDKVADRQGIKSGSRPSRYLEWSRKYNWVESARQYDEQVAYLTVQEASQQYQDDLRAFREKYGKTGSDLHKVGTAMLALFAQNMQGKRIEDKHGNVHVIPAIEMTTATLGQIKSALQAAADLEALALRVDHLLSSDESGRE